MHRIWTLCAAAILCPSLLTAQPQERAKFLAPFMEEQTFLIIRVDFKRIDFAKAREQIKPFLKTLEADTAPGLAMAQAWVTAFRAAGGTELYAVVSMEDLPSGGDPPIVLPLSAGAQVELLQAMLTKKGQTQAKVLSNALVIGNEDQLKRFSKQKALPRPELSEALSAASDSALQVFLVPPPYSRRVVEENLPTLPKEIGGGSSKILTEGIRWAALSAGVSPELQLTVTCQAQDAAAADRLKDWLPKLYAAVARHPEVWKFLPTFNQFTATLISQVQDNRLVLKLDIPQVVKLWDESLPHFRKQADKALGENNLKQLAIAFHNYHGDYDRLPSHAIYDKPGKKGAKELLSWRVLILPYIEQNELFKQFKLDEPWDSEHNKKLIPLMPKMYMVPRTNPPVGHTYYQMVVTPPDYVGKFASMFKRDPEYWITLGRITVADGTSNSIMLVEAAKAVPWTKPEDMELTPENQPLPAFGAILEAKSFPVVFGDGSVRQILKTSKDTKLHQSLLRQMIGWNDGGNQDVMPILGTGDEPPAKDGK